MTNIIRRANLLKLSHIHFAFFLNPVGVPRLAVLAGSFFGICDQFYLSTDSTGFQHPFYSLNGETKRVSKVSQDCQVTQGPI